MYAKAVDHAVAKQQRSVDTECPASRGHETFDLGGCGNECSEAERDTGCDCDLAKQVEPARHPGHKRRMLLWCEDGRPEVRASGRGDRGHNLSHAEADEHGEETHDDPANRHDARAAGGKAIFEKSRNAGDDRLEIKKFLENGFQEG